MPVKVLYTTHAIATGGRNGHTRSADGIVDVDLSIPKAMGGPGRAGAAAHQVRPYSNATRGNLDVGLEVRTV